MSVILDDEPLHPEQARMFAEFTSNCAYSLANVAGQIEIEMTLSSVIRRGGRSGITSLDSDETGDTSYVPDLIEMGLLAYTSESTTDIPQVVLTQRAVKRILRATNNYVEIPDDIASTFAHLMPERPAKTNVSAGFDGVVKPGTSNDPELGMLQKAKAFILGMSG